MANIIEINDLSAPELDVYARLTENQLVNRRDLSEGIFIAESPNVVRRALDSGCVPLSMLLEKKHIDGQAKDIVARCGNIPVFTAPLELLKKLTGFPLTRGVLCAMRRPMLLTVEEVCCNAKRVAVLEDVMNPTNLGAIIRSAAALGMDAVLLTPNSTDPLYRRAIRVSMGTVFQIPWAYLPDNWFDVLHNLGFKTAAMALRENTVSIRDPKLRSIDRLAVILGTEGEGLSDETITKADFTIKIPMYHGVDSLNVAAASAVAFWELGRS